MKKWFKKQSKLVKCILLLIPVVNWVVEVLIRWPHALKKKTLISYLLAIIVTIPTGIAVGLIDCIWVLLFNKMILIK
jgi:hypothetical protein